MRSPHDSKFQAVKAYARAFPFLMAANQKLRKRFQKPESFSYGLDGTTTLNLVTTFPLYAPFTSGSYDDKAETTIQTINRLIPLLSDFAKAQRGKQLDIIDIREFPVSSVDLQCADELKKFFDSHGSDKANAHNYHMLYGRLLKNCDQIASLLEIGVGTSNVDVLSNMSPGGKPGASLRAFRDFLTNAEIYGADIDERILFEEERIKTYYLDQTDSKSFDHLGKRIPSELDLIIDDGLHSPNANINTMLFGLQRIRLGGWLVVEDIAPDAIPVWELVAALLPANYAPHILTAAGFLREKTGNFSINDHAAAVFAVQRIG